MPEKESMRFPAVQMLNWQRSEPPPANGAPPTPAKGTSASRSRINVKSKPFNTVGFRTDTDISQNGPNPRERELQAWSDGTNASGSMPPSGPAPAARGDDITFGSTGPGSWDQFTVNQQLFGVTTNYDEELYTTKLDRSRPDFKERERQAQQIANEIQNVRENTVKYHFLSADNSNHSPLPLIHMLPRSVVLLMTVGSTKRTSKFTYACDHFVVLPRSIRYGAVVRGPNAYVPPAARSNTLSASTSAPSQPISGAPVASSSDASKATTKPNGSEASAADPVGPPKVRYMFPKKCSWQNSPFLALHLGE